VILFQKLVFSNFLSVGNQPVTIELNKTKTTLVHGSNGSGKSTILDALTYALFNKPFRKINLPQLINTQNKKGLLVEVEFSIGKNTYNIQRGIKPKVFRIIKNGEEIDALAADKDNQAYLEQNILKLSYKSFTQIVILGSSSYTPFMSLSAGGRRDVVEDFLDIKVFSTMGIIAKERLRGLREQLNTLKGEVGNREFQLDVQQQRVKELEQRSEDDIREHEDALMKEEDEYEKLYAEDTDLLNDINDLQAIIDILMADNPHKKQAELQKCVIKFANKVERLEKDKSFYTDNDTCHTCNQEITEDTKTTYLTKTEEEIDNFTKVGVEADQHLTEYNKIAQRIAKLEIEKKNKERDRYNNKTKREQVNDNIERENKKIKNLKDESGIIDNERGKLDLMEVQLIDLLISLKELKGTVAEHESVANLLKDGGIKTQIVRRYLPIMNKLLRKYLTELDLPIHFILDEEFNESVASPIYQDFSYASFSEGQKSRIDLALCFMWREICSLKNSVSTNLLILDEVFSSSLDDVGKENLLVLLRYKLDERQRIVVVDHTLSGLFKEKFDNCIEVNRVKGFSQYV